MKKILSLFLAASLVFSIGGCSVFKSVKAPVVAPLTPQQKAAAIVDDFARSVTAAQDLEVQAFKQGDLEKEYHVSFQKLIKQVDDAGPSLVKAAQIGGPDLDAKIKAILDFLSSAQVLQVAHVKNPTTQAAITALLNQASNTIQLLYAVGGSSGQ